MSSYVLENQALNDNDKIKLNVDAIKNKSPERRREMSPRKERIKK